MLSNKSFNDDKGGFSFINVVAADVTEQWVSFIEMASTHIR